MGFVKNNFPTPSASAEGIFFAQKAMNEELLGNYPDSRYLWGQAAEMDRKSKDAGAKAEFFQEVVRNPAALFAAPNSAPKPAKPSVPASRANTTAPSAEIETLPPWQDYLEKSARQVVLGNYTDDVTLAGTAGQIGLGLLGLDLPADLRDLFYDLTHLKSTSWHQTALDAFALLPVVGGLKYADDAIAGAKAAANLSDAAKHADNLMDTGADLVYNGAKQFSKADLMPPNLMDELAASGKKYTPQNVIMVTKNANGDLLWLEQGNLKNGWKHILNEHGSDFSNVGIKTEDEMLGLMKNFLDSEPISSGTNKNGPYAIYTYNGKNYRIGWGDNGYIKSFYPYGRKKQ